MIKKEIFFNREISWLQFNARVLHEAMDARNPLLERVRFLQIFTMNLDEFFMKRVAGIKRQEDFGINSSSTKDTPPKELIEEIRENLLPVLTARSDCWINDISPELEKEGILLLGWSDLTRSEQEKLEIYFDQNLFGALTPLTVDPGHPFPFISNLSTSLGVKLRKGSKEMFARVKIPTNYPAWIRLDPKENVSQGIKFISLGEVINRFLGRLFPGMEIAGSFFFRLTRNADFDHDEDEMDDLLETITEQLRARRFAKVVRLEHSRFVDPPIRELLKSQLSISDNDIYEQSSPVDFSVLSPIWELKISQLKYRSWTPVVPEALEDEKVSMFSVIREKDLLVHHPYESFQHTVERFVQTAVNDPQVLAIKMVLYRTGVDSPFIPYLIRAAELGKQVVCLVELKARFDEESNIQVARQLERAGVHVLYGIVGLKTHCKVTLVVRQEGDSVRSYAHIGTGNYNSTTSQLYTDLGFFTANRAMTRDTIKLFHYLSGGASDTDFDQLVVGPIYMKKRFLELIRFEQNEAAQGKPSRIIAKMNSLEDIEIIEELYAASKIGVKIDLIVRGFCCLRPKVPGLSENITVISVIGRFLEHSRIFYFRNGRKDPVDGTLLMGSADWMSRNLNWRVEALAPIDAPFLKSKIFELLNIFLSDQRQVWELESDGSYAQRVPHVPANQVGTHERLMKTYGSMNSRENLKIINAGNGTPF